jgi:RNA polymerase sigma-70 factor (ECF subfamily)
MTDQEFLNRIQVLDRLLNAIAFNLTRNKEDAGDLMQDTLLRAFTFRASFKEGTNFRAWICTIMRNTFVNAYRKKLVRRKVHETAELIPDVHGSLLPWYNDGVEQLRYNDIARHLEGLSGIYAIPFMLFLQGYTYVEIADFLSLPLGTVKSRIFCARVRLKKIIEGEANHELVTAG